MVVRNTIKRIQDSEAVQKRYSAAQETPLTDFIAILLYQNTRSRTLIDTLFDLALCTSYSKIIYLSEDIATAMKNHFQKEGIVCPKSLKKDSSTMGAIDNIDHNPSSTTSKHSFYGTGISIFQTVVTDNEILVPFLERPKDSQAIDDTVLQDFLCVHSDAPFLLKTPMPIQPTTPSFKITDATVVKTI